MRFLQITIPLLVLLLFNSNSYSQEYLTDTTCGYVDPFLIEDLPEIERTRIMGLEKDLYSKITEGRSQKSNQASEIFYKELYVPVIINFITTRNSPDSLWTSVDGSFSRNEEYADKVLDILNEVYSTGRWTDGSGQNLDAYAQDTVDFKVTFIQGNIDMDGNPHPWVRTFVFEDSISSMPPFYARNGLSSYLDLNTEVPYFVPWHRDNSINAFNKDAMYNSVNILEHFAYEPYNYLNIEVFAPGQGILYGWANSPLGKSASPKGLSGNIWVGNACYLSVSAWNDLGSTTAHEIGHFFSLGHVFNGYGTNDCDEAYLEWISGNCEGVGAGGDRICDTYPTAQDWDECYGLIEGEHCLEYNMPHNPSNIMDYSDNCNAEYFTKGQREKWRGAAASTSSNRDWILQRGYEIVGHDGFCLADPTACNYSPGGSLDIECVYEDAAGVCDGDCKVDSDSDGICDDVDPCIGLACEPCQGETELSTSSGDIPVVTIGNRCWAARDLYSFPSGIEVSKSSAEFKEAGANEQPACVLTEDLDISILSYRPTNGNNVGVLYNWYAVDEFDLCPSGWHVSNDEDWKDLELHIGVGKNEINRFGEVFGRGVVDAVRTNEVFFSGNDNFRDWNGFKGFADYNGILRNQGITGYFWTADEYRTILPYRRENGIFRSVDAWRYEYLREDGLSAVRYPDFIKMGRGYATNRTSLSKTNGMSVRCVKDVN